jgi:hypothetical protein
MKRSAIVALSVILLSTVAIFGVKAQAPVSLDIEQIDAGRFPEVSLQVKVQKNGIVQHGLQPDDFAVFEDKQPRKRIDGC